jgi:hypothetical protein
MFAAQYFVADVPEEISTQIKRQDFLVSKVIDKVADEDEDLVGTAVNDDLSRISLTEKVEQRSSGWCCKLSSGKQKMWTCDSNAKLPEVPIKVYDHDYRAVDTEDRV